MTGFFKVSGSGNDFLALVDETGSEKAPDPRSIQAWCRRGVSLGADGLFVLRRAAGGAVMDYFNADGVPAALCLNGTRCAAQLAFHLGWAEDTLSIRTGAGTVAARRGDATRVTLELPAPGTPLPLVLDVDGIRCAGYGLRVGVPHFVLPWPESLAGAPVDQLGREIRRHPHFEEGTNVNFVRFPDRYRMEIRTFERGVEAETLSCGSGILAGAAVGLHSGRSSLPLRVSVQGGFELEVLAEDSAGSAWLLSGDARVVAQGVLLDGAAVSPPPPAWS